MAYYEMMPAGLPAGLQSGMDSVLNKKFGTATSYAPGTWPDTVNLMGQLPEATASGAIATLEDGADAVPCKNVVATIAPNLDGVSSVTETQTGRNLFNLDRTEGTPDPTDIIISPRILDVTKLFKGLRADNYFYAGYASYSISGGVLSVTTSNNLNYGIAFPVRVKGGASYYLSAILTGANMSVGCYDKDWNFISRIFGMVSDASRSFSTPSNAEYITVVFGSSTLNVEGRVSNIQLELGSTAHDYEPYQTPTVYTALLGRTIYGGTADIVNGDGSEIVKKITVSAFAGTWGAVTNGYGYYISDAETTHNTSVVNPSMMTANQLFTYGSVGCNSAPTWQYGGNDGGATVHTFILPSEYDTLTKANNFLASLQTPLEVTLTLATPTDFSFTGQEIPTMLGYNAFWSDSGDTEVTYRADINLALQALSGSRGLMMALPPAQPETEPEETIEETPEEMER